MKALIISGGAYAPCSGDSFDFVTACDLGYLHAQRMGIRPDLILGDFDSAPAPDTDIPVEKYPCRKDDTDTMLAVKKALSLGSTEIVIACAFGGRLDHTFANLQAGAYAAENGAAVRLIGADTEAWIFRNRALRFPRRDGYSLSVFSITDSASVTVTGAAYECRDLRITNSFPVGVSNEWASDVIQISGKDGTVMVMECRM